jgi:hypothetical protein
MASRRLYSTDPVSDTRRTYDYKVESSRTTSSSSTPSYSARPSILESTYTTRRPTELEKWEFDLANRRAERELRDRYEFITSWQKEKVRRERRVNSDLSITFHSEHTACEDEPSCGHRNKVDEDSSELGESS